MEKTVCFTGHREIAAADAEEVRSALDNEIERQILAGATVFRTGGALGFDTLAAISVLVLKKKYPDIRLELFFPCPDQTKSWREDDVHLYEEIKKRADVHQYVSPVYFRGVMHKRNRMLVDGADLCIAFLKEGASGGTAYTVTYAQKKGVPVINLAKKD